MKQNLRSKLPEFGDCLELDPNCMPWKEMVLTVTSYYNRKQPFLLNDSSAYTEKPLFHVNLSKSLKAQF